MRTIRVAVPAYVVKDPNYLGEIGYPRMILNEDFPRAIQEAGAACFILGATSDLSLLEEQLALMDAVILAGGDDVHPHRYGQEPTYSRAYDHLRDAFEFEVLRIAQTQKKPVLGICRGMQLMNCFFGGTLYQDLKDEKASDYTHNQYGQIRYPFHDVNVEPESRLFQAVQTGKLSVNSLHHQAIHELAPGFTVAARSKDGIIEAIEKAEGSFAAGVQWHPEMMSTHSEDAKAIFRYFFNQVRIENEDFILQD